MDTTTNPNPLVGKTIGEIVAADYRTAGIFEKHGIDFCCGGKSSLAVACREQAIDPVMLVREIEAVTIAAADRSQNYSTWTLSFLADHIVNIHHAYLKENIPQIAAYAQKIARVHGPSHPEVVEIAAIFDKVAVDMTTHLHEEEEVLFPAIKRIETSQKARKSLNSNDIETLKRSYQTLSREHETIGDATHHIRRLARGYAIPPGVCNTFMVTYHKLKEFEDDLHKHVHLENNILFPKALLLSSMPQGTGTTPTQIMDAEHRLIENVVRALSQSAASIRNGQHADAANLAMAAEFLRTYADRLHHGKEEMLFFPALVKRGVPPQGCPIGGLNHEHEKGRNLVSALAEQAAAYGKGQSGAQEALLVTLHGLSDLYENHIWKEDAMVFPMGDRVLTEADNKELCEKFAEVDRSVGLDVLARWEQFAKSLASAAQAPLPAAASAGGCDCERKP